MNVRELAAGTICCGFDGTDVQADVRRALTELQPAGVILFARNVRTVAQTRELTDSLRALYPGIPPLIGIDQEGGRVMRLRDGVVEIPSMMALGATASASLSRRAGAQMAHDLRRIGVTINFAPVLDLALQEQNTVIGTRSFGGDPQQVVHLAGAFAQGLESGGITATYKHFPGHGSTAADSHTELPEIHSARDELRARDLLPFIALLPAARAVMTAHIVVHAFEPHPATYARALLTGVLREEIGFRGVCFTDCMQMDAIARGVGTVRGTVLALRAGADCVLISHSIALARDVQSAIVDAVDAGALSLHRLEEAYERTRELRLAGNPPVAIDAPAPDPAIGDEIALEALHIVRGHARLRAGRTGVISFESATNEGVVGAHSEHASLGDFAAEVALLRIPLEPAAADIARALAFARSREDCVVLMRRAHVYATQREAVEAILREKPMAVIVSMREPYDAQRFPQAENVIEAFSDERPTIAALARVLF